MGGNHGNTGNQSRNDENQDGNAGNQDGNLGNKLKQKNKMKVYEIQFSFSAEIKI